MLLLNVNFFPFHFLKQEQLRPSECAQPVGASGGAQAGSGSGRQVQWFPETLNLLSLIQSKGCLHQREPLG